MNFKLDSESGKKHKKTIIEYSFDAIFTYDKIFINCCFGFAKLKLRLFQCFVFYVYLKIYESAIGSLQKW